MGEYTPLTINCEATREAILKQFRFVKDFARSRRIPDVTLSFILRGKYPCPSNHKKSAYQRCLQKMQRAGVLIQSSGNDVADKAA